LLQSCALIVLKQEMYRNVKIIERSSTGLYWAIIDMEKMNKTFENGEMAADLKLQVPSSQIFFSAAIQSSPKKLRTPPPHTHTNNITKVGECVKHDAIQSVGLSYVFRFLDIQ
jgi:hypothetical protein